MIHRLHFAHNHKPHSRSIGHGHGTLDINGWGGGGGERSH